MLPGGSEYRVSGIAARRRRPGGSRQSQTGPASHDRSGGRQPVGCDFTPARPAPGTPS